MKLKEEVVDRVFDGERKVKGEENGGFWSLELKKRRRK